MYKEAFLKVLLKAIGRGYEIKMPLNIAPKELVETLTGIIEDYPYMKEEIECSLFCQKRFMEAFFKNEEGFVNYSWKSELGAFHDPYILTTKSGSLKPSEFHLQQIVLEDDKVKYLEKFL
jgi:hypothetical protein